MRITFLGTKGYIEESNEKHKKYTAILVEAGRCKYLIDCGEKEYLETKPTYILVTHLHPDHFNIESTDIPVVSHKHVYDKLDKEKFPNKMLVKIGEEKRIGCIPFTFYKVEHSTKAPAVAIKFKSRGKTVLYAPDVISIIGKEDAFKGVDLYIGDASSWKGEPPVRRTEEGDLVGHADMRTQVNWCKDFGVKHIIFTHLGKIALEKEDEILKELKELYPEADIKFAYDGMVIEDKEFQVDASSITPSQISSLLTHYAVLPSAVVDIVKQRPMVVCSKNDIGERAFLYVTASFKLLGVAVAEKLSEANTVDVEEEDCSIFYRLMWLYDVPEREVTYQRTDLFNPITELTIETFIENIAEYDPTKPNNEQLADDWRICCGWYSTKKRGGKLKFTLKEIEELAFKIFKEIIRRVTEGEMKHTFKPSEMKKWSRELYNKLKKRLEPEWKAKLKEIEAGELKEKFKDLTVEDIVPDFLENLTDEELEEVYEWLHQKYLEEGRVTEELANANIFIWQEFKKRGIEHDIEDDLDRYAVLVVVEYPSPEGIQLSESYIHLGDVLANLPDRIETSKKFVYLIGRLVNEGKVPATHDIDIGIRQDNPEYSLTQDIALQVPVWLARRFHFVFDSQLPKIGYGIPVYRIVLEKIRIAQREHRDITEMGVTLFEPFIPLKPKSGLGKLEFWDNNEAWQKWASERIDRGLLVQRKFDGRRFQIHVDKANNKVAFYTEDRLRDRSKVFPESVKEALEKLNCDNCILDAEACVYEFEGEAKTADEVMEKGKLVPREDTAFLTVAKKVDERGLIFHVFDIIYLNGKDLSETPYIERYELYQKVIPKDCLHFEAVKSCYADNYRSFIECVLWARKTKFSEGAVVKTADMLYPIKYEGENRTSDMSKIKNLKDIDVMVWDRVEKKSKKTGKGLGQYMYDCVILIPCEDKDKYKDVYEWKGKCYAKIGRTYATATKCKKGDIIRVKVAYTQVTEKDGKKVITWQHPIFLEKRTDKEEPDTITTVERIAEVGSGYLEQEELGLPICPFWNNPSICPFRNKMVWTFALKYPISCKIARYYRCVYAKSYYYDDYDLSSGEVLENANF